MRKTPFVNIRNGIANTASGLYNSYQRKYGENLRPKWVAFQITDRCNSRCLHCNIWKSEDYPTPLTADEIGAVFRDSLFKDTEYIQISGGEPALRDDLEDVLLIMHEALPNATIQLSTNGLLPKRTLKVTKTALESGINLCVGVSIDGLDENHDKLRGVKGNFKKADLLLNELSALRDHFSGKLHVAAGIVLSDLTIDSIEEVRDYTRSLGIDLTEAWYNECEFYGNENKNMAQSKKLIHAIKSQPPSPLKELWLKKLSGKSYRFPCFAMHSFCVLKYNGDIVPCLNYFNTPAGNVRENSPTEIWHSDRMRAVRKMVDNCSGCLNSWGAGWSLKTSYYQYLKFYLNNPKCLLTDLKRR